jgi:hypothetical protein
MDELMRALEKKLIRESYENFEDNEKLLLVIFHAFSKRKTRNE